MARLMMRLQDSMVQNERDQYSRAARLDQAIRMVVATVPAATLAALISVPLSDQIVLNSHGSAQSATSSATPPSGHVSRFLPARRAPDGSGGRI